MPFDVDAFTAASSGYGGAQPQRPQRSNGSGIGNELEAAARSYIATFGHIAGALGSDAAREWARAQEDKAAQASARSGWTQSYEDVDISRPSTIASYVGHLAVQSLPYAAEAIAAAASMGSTAVATGAARAGLRLAGREATEAAVQGTARTGAAVVGSYPSSVGTVLGAQDEQAGRYGLGSAAALGAPYAALNAVGIEGALARRAMPAVEARSRVARAVGTGLRVGASEGASEVGQQAAEEAGRAAVDPGYEPLGAAPLRRYAESAVGGFALGGVAGGGRGALSRRPEAAPAAPAPAPISDTEPTNLLSRGQSGNLFGEPSGPTPGTVDPRSSELTRTERANRSVTGMQEAQQQGLTGLADQLREVGQAPAAPAGVSEDEVRAALSERARFEREAARAEQAGDSRTYYRLTDAMQQIDAFLAQNSGTVRRMQQQEAGAEQPGLGLFRGEAAPAQRPGGMLALPAPQGPTLFVDQAGTAATSPDIQGAAANFVPPARPNPDDYSATGIHRTLTSIVGQQAVKDALTLKLSTALGKALAEGKADRAAALLASEDEKLQTNQKVSGPALETKLAILRAAQQVIARYAERNDIASRQSAEAQAAAEINAEAQQAEQARREAEIAAKEAAAKEQLRLAKIRDMVAKAKALGGKGVVVDKGPADDRAASAAAVREQAATPANSEEVTRPQAVRTNTAEDVEGLIANEAAERSRAERRGLLQAVLDDPTTVSPVGRFRAALRKAGFRATALTEEEAATIERFEAVRDAVPEQQDRSGVEALEAQIPERKAPAPQQPKAKPEYKAPRLNLLGATDLEAPPQAQPEATPQPDAGTIADPAQVSMFRGNTRGFTKTATGETRKQLIAEADRLLASLGGTKSKEIMGVAIRAFAAGQIEMSFVRDVAEALKAKKYGVAKALVEPFQRAEAKPAEAPAVPATPTTQEEVKGNQVEAPAPTPEPAAKPEPPRTQGTLRLTPKPAAPAPVAEATPAPAKPSPMQVAMEKAMAEKAQAEAERAKAEAEKAQAEATVAKAQAEAVAPTKEQVKAARRTVRDRVEAAEKAKLITPQEAQDAYRLVATENPQAIRLVQDMLNERVAAKRSAMAPTPAPTPAPAPTPPGRVISPEEVKARLLRDRAATGVRNEITQAQTRGDITRQQAANLRETLKADGEAAARQQMQSYLDERGSMRRAGTARTITAPQDTRTVETEGDTETAPGELNFDDNASPRVATPGQTMQAEDVLQLVKERTRGWRNAPNVQVAQSMEDLPPGLWDVRRSPTGVSGLYDQSTGTVYLVADNLSSPEQAAATLYHEALGHFGLGQAFQGRVSSTMDAIYRTNREVRQLADGYLTQNPNVFRGMDREARATEEVLAMAAEQGRPIPLGIMQRLKALVTQFARRMGLYNGSFSNEEVAAILNRAMRAVTDGTPPSGGGIRAEAAPSLATPNLASTDGIRSLVQQRAGLFTDTSGVARRLRLTSLFQRNLEELYGKLLPTLSTYNNLLFRMSAKVNKLTSDAHTLLDRWNRLDGDATRSAAEVQKEVEELALDATFYQIRPDLPLTDEANSEIASDADHTRYSEMKARFDALPEQARNLYGELFNKFAANLAAKKALFKAQIEASEGLTRDAKARSLKEIDAFFKRVKVYFPLMRFGQFIVIARSKNFAEAEEQVQAARAALDQLTREGATPEQIEQAKNLLSEARREQERMEEGGGYSVQAFEREGVAQREAKRLREQGMLVTQQLAHKYQPEVDGVSSRFLEQINATLDQQGMKSPEARTTAEHLKNLFTQAYFQSLPEHSALKRNLKRKFVQGFNKDAKRGFAAAMVRDAHYLARLEFGQQTKDALEDMRREARAADKAAQDEDPNRPMLAQEVFEEVNKRHAASLRYVETPVQDVAANVGYLWFLGFTPSFMALNLLQTPMVTLPMMAARHGMAKSGAALVQAAKEVGRAQISAWKKDGAFGEIDINTLDVPADEKAMLQTLLDSGIIDLTQEHDMGTIAQGGNTKWRAMMRVASFLPHYTEKVNRLATALGAYRLAMQEKQANPGTRLDPVKYAEKMVADSHFDYSAENAPRWMRPGAFPLSKVMFQFRKYQLAMGYAVVNNFAQAIKSADPEEKRLAKRTLLGLLMSHGMAAGTLGLPGAALAVLAANMMHDLFGDDDDPWEAQAAYRNFLADVFGGLTDDPELGKQVGEMVARGALRAPGVRDLLPGDISGRVGLGDLFTPVRTRKSDAEGRARWNEILAAMWGPVGTVAGDMFEATRYFGQGDFAKGVELSLPKAARDMLRAYRFGTEGVTTARGNTVLGADGIPTGELVAQALGFTPSRIMEQYEARSAIEGAKQALTQRRQGLLRAYSEAQLAGDADALADARVAIQAYNTLRRERNEPLIRAQDMLRSVQERRQFERDLTQGARLRRNERPLAEYGRFAVLD